MVLTIGLLGVSFVLCRRSAANLEQARSALSCLDVESLERRAADLERAGSDLAQAVDLQG